MPEKIYSTISFIRGQKKYILLNLSQESIWNILHHIFYKRSVRNILYYIIHKRPVRNIIYHIFHKRSVTNILYYIFHKRSVKNSLYHIFHKMPVRNILYYIFYYNRHSETQLLNRNKLKHVPVSTCFLRESSSCFICHCTHTRAAHVVRQAMVTINKPMCATTVLHMQQ